MKTDPEATLHSSNKQDKEKRFWLYVQCETLQARTMPGEQCNTRGRRRRSHKNSRQDHCRITYQYTFNSWSFNNMLSFNSLHFFAINSHWCVQKLRDKSKGWIRNVIKQELFLNLSSFSKRRNESKPCNILAHTNRFFSTFISISGAMPQQIHVHSKSETNSFSYFVFILHN